MSIQSKIDKVIKSLGSINIQDFVEISNFDKDGFYNLNEKEKISKSGHFITTPEITSLFGYCLCNQFLNHFPDTKLVHLVELGPGNGTLTSDILEYLVQKKIKVSKISFIEKSCFFKKKIKTKFSREINIIDKISDLDLLGNETLFMYSNEFFDAFGSKQYIWGNSTFSEIKITKEKDQYRLIHEHCFLSNILENIYPVNDFKDGDILEHSTLLIYLYQELNSVLKKNFFFSATDYGYLNLPKRSTLRLVSGHEKKELFEKFENIDYSFEVNFKLFSDSFKKFFPIIMNQHDFIYQFIPTEFKTSKDSNIIKTVDIISGKSFNNMGEKFLNISFFQK